MPFKQPRPSRCETKTTESDRMKKIRSGFEDLKTVILLACIDPWPEASHDQIGQVQSYSPLVVCRRECAVWTKTLPGGFGMVGASNGPKCHGFTYEAFLPPKAST